MKSIRLAFTALSVALALSACAATGSPMVTKSDGVLVNTAGMTLYTFDKDVANSGKSACGGPCLALWPAAAAGDATPEAPYSVVVREDGFKQLAYKGKPLYLYSSDSQKGDRKGDNFKEIWHVVRD